jgi:CubicO group peptidase (beta-lactamase class C family)
LKAGPFSMTARDMAKFGVLYLNGGQWNGKQIIPADWVKESTSPQVGNYGYLWWVHENGYSASGAGGTLLRMIPKLGVAAVFQCKHLNRFRDPRIIVDEWIVPAVAETRTMSSAIMKNGKRKGDCNSLS